MLANQNRNMQISAEELNVFLEARQHRIAEFVDPEAREAASRAIRENIAARLPDVPDPRSLESLLEVEAVDFALRPFTGEFAKENPDRDLIDRLFAWRGRYVTNQILRTIRIHAGPDPSEADALLADVLSALWEKRREFDSRKGPFVAWARGIALNRARSKRSTKRREVSLDADPERPLDLPSTAPTAEDSLARGPSVEGPPAEGFAEILRLVQESEPHKAIAFLLNRYLDRKPAQIAAEMHKLPLPEAFARLKQAVVDRFPDIAGIDALLAPLSARVNGLHEAFGEHGREEKTLAEEVGRWVAEVQRSVGRTISQLGKQFLRCVSELSAAVHEVVSYLWLRFLHAAPVELRQEAHRELLPLIERFQAVYSRRELLSQEQIDWATAPLRKRIPAGRALQDFAGGDFYTALRRWCQRVDSLIPGTPCSEGMLGYAYLSGALLKGRPT